MVKCADCGFLAARHSANRTLDEVEASMRKTGLMPENLVNRKVELYEKSPLCFALAFDLHQEIGANTSPDRILAVIQKDRLCKSWQKYHQGHTPKEHEEMVTREELRKWQEQQKWKDRLWSLIYLFVGAFIAYVFGKFK